MDLIRFTEAERDSRGISAAKSEVHKAAFEVTDGKVKDVEREYPTEEWFRKSGLEESSRVGRG